MRLPLTGGCQCGLLRYEIAQAPRTVLTCHCIDCQRMTSSAFSIGFTIIDAPFHLSGPEPKLVQRVAESGNTRNRWLCPVCDLWLCGGSKPNSADALRIVRAGSLDDTSWLLPTLHLWTRSKQPWVTLPPGGRCFETQPPNLYEYLLTV